MPLPQSGAGPQVEVVELKPRNTTAAEPSQGGAVAVPAQEEPAAIEWVGEYVPPYTLSVLGAISYQSLDGDDDAGRMGDYLVGYLDVVLEAPLWEGAAGVVEWESVGGNGPDDDVPRFAGGTALFGWNANGASAQDGDGFDRFYLAEAFVSMEDCCFEDWIFDIGKLASTSYIDTVRVANDSVGQFVSGPFCNSGALDAPYRGGGLALSYVGCERMDFRCVAMRPDNGANDAANHVFGAAQVGVYWAQSTRPGSLALYGWSDGAANDQLGVGLNADQDIGERVTAFGRLGFQEEDDVPGASDIHRAWSTGFELRRGLTGRDTDTFAMAVGQITSDDHTLDTETQFEAYYRREFNANCSGSLHWQTVQHPAGAQDVTDVTSLGVRMVFAF